MDDLCRLYRMISGLREAGTKMKEIAACLDWPASVVSSLYTTVLPAYAAALQKDVTGEDALDQALALVNNVSKKRLLTALPGLVGRLEAFGPLPGNERTDNSFSKQWWEVMRLSAGKIADICGTYTSYSLSSSSDRLKQEPFLFTLSGESSCIQAVRLSAYGELQRGVAMAADAQSLYIQLNEAAPPHFMLVTIYLQIPFFRHPHQLRGLYLGLDYNRNPVARRLLLIRESGGCSVDEFRSMPSGLISPDDFTPEQEAYYRYTCQPGDCIKMCTVPSLRMDESDLLREKMMLEL